MLCPDLIFEIYKSLIYFNTFTLTSSFNPSDYGKIKK